MNDLNEAEIEKLAEAIARKICPSSSCALGIDAKELDEERKFVRTLMDAADRLDNIKWGFLGTMIKSFGLFIIGLIGLGALVWAKSKLGIHN